MHIYIYLVMHSVERSWKERQCRAFGPSSPRSESQSDRYQPNAPALPYKLPLDVSSDFLHNQLI